MNSKIKTIKEIQQIVKCLKLEEKKVLHCHGVFDLLHIGHIKHFEEAKSIGDVLVVTVTPDEFVNKGPNRPAFTTSLRLQALASLESIDYVVANQFPTAVQTIKLLQPSIYCKGKDYKNHKNDLTGEIDNEAKAIDDVGGSIYYTDDIMFSSSNLLNKYGEVFDDSQKSFIGNIINKQSLDFITDKLDEIQNLKVLVIGETIIDQYVFCEALGKSGKEPVLVLRDLKMEQYSGGAAAIARHLSGFCKDVTILSVLGEKKEFEEFVRLSFPDNVKSYFIYKKNSPTIIKKRYLDSISNSKTLGIYTLDDSKMNEEDQKKLTGYFSDCVKNHDLIIISDYGHGFISPDFAKAISNQSVFTTLNAQINAANIGYHTMNNYFGMDCVIINETELRHELRDRENELEVLMVELSEKLKAKNLVVTRGSSGAKLYEANNSHFYCPAFASKIVDKIGAGDAMLALLSCSLKVGLDPNLSLFIGSLAAGQSVETIGNSVPVNKTKLLKTLAHTMK